MPLILTVGLVFILIFYDSIPNSTVRNGNNGFVAKSFFEFLGLLVTNGR